MSRVEPAILHERILSWYVRHARDLPWRGADVPAWHVMVSEFMLQQTPVSRVLPVYLDWVARWPEPVDLAAAAPGDAVRAWGRLGYPRRALRLHAAATAIVTEHDGRVPSELDELRALSGVGDYTAAAVASFAYGRRHAVLDTNVRRVVARVVMGQRFPPSNLRASERQLAQDLLPEETFAARWGVAVMELGAICCTAATPGCAVCPVADVCAWRLAGYPAHDGPPRRTQSWQGTDRQCRGRLLATLRDATGPVPRSSLEAVWADSMQRERALDGLVSDGLAEPLAGGRYALPGTAPTWPRSKDSSQVGG